MVAGRYDINPIPKYQLPSKGVSGDAAYQLIHDQLCSSYEVALCDWALADSLLAHSSGRQSVIELYAQWCTHYEHHSDILYTVASCT